MKKAPEASRLEEQEKKERRKNIFQRSKIGEISDSAAPVSDKLRVLGQRAGRVKTVLSGSAGSLAAWGKSLKEKRRRGRAGENLIRTEESGTVDAVQAGTEDHIFRRTGLGAQNQSHHLESERADEPENRPARKEMLEKILIERIAANPKDIEAYERLGEYYMEIGSWGDAKECLKQVIKLDSTNESAKGKMKRLERMLGR